MAKHKYEFKPDKTGPGLLSKLYLTKKQRLQLLKWTLCGAMLLVLSVLQDVILCRMSIFGATTDLMPCIILLVCVYQGVESGSVFALVASALYQFSGTAPGYYVIALLTTLGIAAAIFRQSLLRKSRGSDLLCAGVAFTMYELIVYLVALARGLSSVARLPEMAVTVILSLLPIALLYPLVRSIDRIGGETWKE